MKSSAASSVKSGVGPSITIAIVSEKKGKACLKSVCATLHGTSDEIISSVLVLIFACNMVTQVHTLAARKAIHRTQYLCFTLDRVMAAMAFKEMFFRDIVVVEQLLF